MNVVRDIDLNEMGAVQPLKGIVTYIILVNKVVVLEQ